MNDRVKHYTIKVTLEGPVFIGSGQSIGKKEYLFDPRRKLVSIPDMAKLYQFLQNSRLMDAYETYMLEGWDDLSSWMRKHGVLERQFAPWIAYSIDSGDAVFENRGKKEIAIRISIERRIRLPLCTRKQPQRRAQNRPFVVRTAEQAAAV